MDNKPTQLQFNSALTAIQAAASEYNATCDTHKGSVVYQLLVRPLSYIYAKLYKFIRDFSKSVSLAQLSTSTATDTQQLDAIASNFMLSRKAATQATGFVTVILQQPTLFISDSIRIYIQEYEFTPRSRVLILAQGQAQTTVTQDTQIVFAYPVSGSRYQAQLPIICTRPGYLAISKYSTVSYDGNLPSVVDMQLLAPITGGSDVETDMQLVSRIQNIAMYAAQDTHRAIQKRLENAPFPAASIYAVGGAENMRSFYNTALISTGGTVDVYVKTQEQVQVLHVNVAATATQSGAKIVLDPIYAAGCYKIMRLLDMNGNLLTVSELIFKSSIPQSLSDDAAVLSAYQQIQLYSPQLIPDNTYTVVLSRVPGILENQKYIQSPKVRFIGQSVLLHAALPVDTRLSIGLSCTQPVSEQQLVQMQQFIARLINQSPVGQSILNISDIDIIFAQAYPGFHLKAPCTICCAIPTRDNDMYTFTSESFYIDIQQRLGIYTWPSCVYAFRAAYSDIQLIQVQK